MRKRLIVACAFGALTVAHAPVASADPPEPQPVCNYGGVVSDVAMAPGPASEFTETTDPFTINQNNTNIPANPNGEVNVCQFG